MNPVIVYGDRAVAPMSEVVPPDQWSFADTMILFVYRATSPKAGEWRYLGAANPPLLALEWVRGAREWPGSSRE